MKYVGENLYNSRHLNKEAAGSYSIQLAPREYVSVHTAVPCSVLPKDIKRSTSQLPGWKGLGNGFPMFSVACKHYGLQPRLAGIGQHLNARPQGSQGIFPCLPKGYQRLARQETHLGQWLGKWLRGNPWKSMEILENFWFFAIFQPKSLGRFGKFWTDWQDPADQFRFGFWFGGLMPLHSREESKNS